MIALQTVHSKVLANGTQVGYIFTDKDEPGKVFLELSGVTCKEFNNISELTLWLLTAKLPVELALRNAQLRRKVA